MLCLGLFEAIEFNKIFSGTQLCQSVNHPTLGRLSAREDFIE